MRTTSTTGGKMFLSILAFWILFTISAGSSSSAGLINLPCCLDGSDEVNGDIIECFKQKPRGDCPKHFYLVVLEKGMFRINPHSKWLQWKMRKGNLKCPQCPMPHAQCPRGIEDSRIEKLLQRKKLFYLQ